MKMKLLTIAVAAAVCASPAVYAKDNKYLSAAGQSITVGQSEADTNYNNRVLGGSRDSSGFKSGSVTVTGGPELPGVPSTQISSELDAQITL